MGDRSGRLSWCGAHPVGGELTLSQPELLFVDADRTDLRTPAAVGAKMHPLLNGSDLRDAQYFAGHRGLDRRDLFGREDIQVGYFFHGERHRTPFGAGAAVGSGIQFHDLSGRDVGRMGLAFVHDRIGEETQGTGEDMEHLAEWKIGQAQETGEEVKVPKDSAGGRIAQPGGEGLEQPGCRVARKGPSRRGHGRNQALP
jgi:hypothetical protein